MMQRISRLPTRSDLAKTVLGIILSAAALVVLWPEAFGTYDERDRCAGR
jgi:hypothetical protein